MILLSALPSCDLVTSILEEKNFKRIKSNIARLWQGEEKSIQVQAGREEPEHLCSMSK